MEPWMQTFSGGRYYWHDRSKSQIRLIDIAHALSNICRFGGHSKFYSVAQHSVFVSRLVGTESNGRYTFFSIMHDAGEAYIGDIVKPLKHSLGDTVDELERKCMLQICEYFDVPPLGSIEGDEKIAEAIKRADNIALATEVRDLVCTPDIGPWGLSEKPYGGSIDPLGPEESRSLFLKRFFNSNQSIARMVFAKEPDVIKYMHMNTSELKEFSAMVCVRLV